MWLSQMPNSKIADMDPLGLDPLFDHLPFLNEKGECEPLVCVTESSSKLSRVKNMNTWAAFAAMRDLGMILSSLRRHAVWSPSHSPVFTEALLHLAEITAMPPRETVIHYCVWNPIGSRRRTFIGDPQEHGLITVTAHSVLFFEQAARTLGELVQVSPRSPTYSSGCLEAAASIAEAVRIMKLQIKQGNLDAEHFLTKLRPFFEPADISGRSYNAAAAAQSPLFLVDECVWGADSADHTLRAFREELASYGLPKWADSFYLLSQESSLVGRLISCLRETPSSDIPNVEQSARALLELFRQLLTFRAGHRRLVRTAYDRAMPSYDLGSAGASIELIDLLLRATRDYVTLIKSPNRMDSNNET